MSSDEGGSSGRREERSGERRPAESPGEEAARAYVAVFEEGEDPGTPWLRRGAAILVVAVGAAYLLHGAIDPGEPNGAVGSGQGRAATVPSDRRAGPGDPSSAVGGPAREFERRAEAAAAALDRYGERQRMYEEDRLGCGSLRTAHDAVDRSFLEAALTFRDHRAALDSTAHTRFAELAERADRVDRHFDGAGCRSPG